MTWTLLRGRSQVRFLPRAPLKQEVIWNSKLISIDGVTQGLHCNVISVGNDTLILSISSFIRYTGIALMI
jgi:hypothetical protein